MILNPLSEISSSTPSVQVVSGAAPSPLHRPPRPRYKRNTKLSFYPKGSTWSPGFIPDLLTTRPAKRLASYQLKQDLVSAEIQRLEEEEFCIRGKLLAANAIELAFKML